MDDDTKAMLRLKNGDRSAFDELYNRFKTRIYNYVFRYLGNVYVSEDVTQEVFVKMYISAKDYEPKAQFSTWLFTIATNLAINEYHRIIRSDALDTDAIQDDKPLTEEKVVFGDKEKSLLNAIGKLPENQRTAILLRTYEGMDYKEIADVMHVSIKAVKSLLNRARKRLLDEYKNFDM